MQRNQKIMAGNDHPKDKDQKNDENRLITDAKLEKYFSITKEALDKVRSSPMCKDRKDDAEDFLDMAQRYYDDAGHFRGRGDIVDAFAALNYAHGWLDAGARIGLFKVKDSRLFTVDDQSSVSD